MPLPPRSIAELRAIVGDLAVDDNGVPWSDERLLAAEASAQQFAALVVERRRDELDPAAAQRRDAARRAADQVLLDKRRRRYAREREAHQRKQSIRRTA